MTEKLFWKDAYQTQFTARVIEHFPVAGGHAVVLDRTCFYATSGGQPNDLGTLGGQPVKDVKDEGEKLIHVLPSAPSSDQVEGVVDAKRRRDHMQQHTGQHILSAAFFRLFRAETSSFHLGEEYCSIELNQPGLTEQQIQLAEQAANEVIFAGTPVDVFFIEPAQAGQYPLRKQPDVGENLRIVRVGDFDLSPCSGTHVRNAAEVGMVFVTGSEKISQGTKVSFLCGGRIGAAYRKDLAVLKDLSKMMTTSTELLPESVRGLQAQTKDLRKENMQFKEGRLKAEAMKMLMNAESWNGHHLMIGVWSRPYQELRYLAQKLAEQAGTVGAFVSTSENRAVFFRNSMLPLDLKTVFHEFLSQTSGKGGGAPHFLEAGNFQSIASLDSLVRSLFR
jgi:alanyl-tRNA synthetase